MPRNAANAIQLYRGTTEQNNMYTGAAGELTGDMGKKTVRFHDGTTRGGFPLVTEKRQVSAIDPFLKINGGATGTLEKDVELGFDMNSFVSSLSPYVGVLPDFALPGMVVAFTGTFSGRNPIPEGSTTPDTDWVLCDGQETDGVAVPNMSGKFILGAGPGHVAGSEGAVSLSATEGVQVQAAPATRSYVPSAYSAAAVEDAPMAVAEGSLTYYVLAYIKQVRRSGGMKSRNVVVKTPVINLPTQTPNTGVATSFTVTSGSLLEGGAISYFLVDIPELGMFAERAEAGDGATGNYSITVPRELSAGTVLHVRAVAFDTVGNQSQVGSLDVTVTDANVSQAVLSAPNAGATIVYNDAGITLSTAPFATDGGVSDTHVATDWKVTSDIGGVTPVLQASDNTGTTTHTFTAQECSGLSDGQVLYAFARHKGAVLGWGQWSSPVNVVMKKGIVNTPVISTPTEGQEIMMDGGTLSVTSSAFSVNAGTDTHASTDWKITSDASGNTIVKQDAGSADKTSHTFTGLSLSNGATYYLFVRYNGTKYGASAWSAARSFTASVQITSAGGRKLYRHSSGMGTVIEFTDNGTAKSMIVLDAKYRGVAKWDSVYTSSNSNSLDTSLPNITAGTGYPTGGQTTTAAAASVTEATINAYFISGKRDPNTAKYNTDDLRNSTYASRMAAAKLCRDVSIPGLGACDLPNIQEVFRIYCEAEQLDKMDPTVASYPGYKLSGWSFSGVTSAGVWSSTEYDSNYAWRVYLAGQVGYDGKNQVYGVVPVLEI